MAPGEERDPGRRASAELPLYGVEGWPGQRQIASSSGIGRPDRGSDKVALMSVGVNHSHGDASITITSHRQQDNDLARLQRFGDHAWDQSVSPPMPMAGLNLIDDVALIIEVKPVALTFPGC